MTKPIATRLGDIVNFKRGYDLPESERRLGPYPVISSAGVSGFHDEYKARGEGVITGRYGTLGEMHYYNGEYWPHNTALYVTEFKKNIPKYVYYLLSCLGRMATGDKSTVPGVNRNDLHELEIPFIGDRSVQKKIAAFLSSIDVKIDLNNRANAELEALAKTIYDYWFVQFDFPDAKGHPYKTSGGKMVWNEALKREIPAGWTDNNISAIAEVFGGATPSKSKAEYWNGDIPFFTPTDASSHVFQLQTEDSITTAGQKSCSSDIFRKGTIFITARGSVGKIAIAGRPMAMNQSCYALAPKVTTNYPYVFLHARTLIHHLKVKATGSTFNSIVTNDIEWTRLISPAPEIVSGFCRVVSPIFERIEVSQRENIELSQFRDWLLPMLMNGQVRVA